MKRDQGLGKKFHSDHFFVTQSPWLLTWLTAMRETEVYERCRVYRDIAKSVRAIKEVPLF